MFLLNFFEQQATAHHLSNQVWANLRCEARAMNPRPAGTAVVHIGSSIGIPACNLHHFTNIQIDIGIGLGR